jgi:hypothetical protein
MKRHIRLTLLQDEAHIIRQRVDFSIHIAS